MQTTLGELVAFNSLDPRLADIVSELLNEVHTTDDTRPRKCIVCGRITYFDPISSRHRCQYCGS